MIVTFSDIENANNSNEYSSFISLELPKNINVATNGELTNTTMSVKLFNLFTIKKVNVRLLTDTDVYVGGLITVDELGVTDGKGDQYKNASINLMRKIYSLGESCQ